MGSTRYDGKFVAIDLSNRRLVVDCPVCKRTIWANSTCHHGQVPPPGSGGKPPERKRGR